MRARFQLVLILSLLANSSAGAAVVVTYRGTSPNIFNREAPYLTDRDFDINSDGIADFRFTGDYFVPAIQGYNGNRFWSTLSIPPDLGGNVRPIPAGSVVGLDAALLPGAWHTHTDNGGGSGFSLFLLQHVDAYIGVEFQAADGIHYGWIQYTGYGVPQFPAYDLEGNFQGFYLSWDHPGGMINSWAWETEPGKPILVGVVPEPGTWFLLSGAIGLSYCRRRRAK
jgi:hypothetical protein